MKSGKQPYILNASSNLIGICFILIAGLKFTKMDATTLADEISTGSAFCFMIACPLSYVSLRMEKNADLYEKPADRLFLAGMLSLFFSILIFATGVL